MFDKVRIQLQPEFYKQRELVIEAPGATSTQAYVKQAKLGGKPLKSFIVDHADLVNAGRLTFEFK